MLEIKLQSIFQQTKHSIKGPSIQISIIATKRIQNGGIYTKHLETRSQVSDIFTNALGKESFVKLSVRLALLDLGALT